MNHFERRDGALWVEDVPLADIAAAVGTPAYVYSAATLRRHYRVFHAAWGSVDHLVCFAVKACSNIGVLALLAREGAGFDIVSGGELHRVLLAGGDPAKVVFSGVGKAPDEMAAALEAGILCFNVESVAELGALNEVARRVGRAAPISLRINPDVDPKTHPYIATGLKRNKFGIPFDEARAAYRHARGLEHLEIVGLDYHIGSQLSETGPVLEATRRMLELVGDLARDGIALTHLDVGGGLGITYRDEAPPSPAEYAGRLMELLAAHDLKIITEPGRVIAGNAGVLLMRCMLTKTNGGTHFIVVDAAMNDNIRPALYDAYQAIEPVGPPAADLVIADVVGPVCESGDFFARDRELPAVEAGELLVMRSAGAYGFAMASNYNSRPRAVEVLVDGDRVHVVRERETLDDLVRGESVPDFD